MQSIKSIKNVSKAIVRTNNFQRASFATMKPRAQHEQKSQWQQQGKTEQEANKMPKSLTALKYGCLVVAVTGATVTALTYDDDEKKIFAAEDAKKSANSVDYDKVRKEIEAIIAQDENKGPTFVRLAWHSSGTYGVHDKLGGSSGGRIRHEPESKWGANAGLTPARAWLDSVKKNNPNITYADLFTFAGVVAIETMGGPQIPWRPGRSDEPDGKKSPPDGRLPDASKGPQHVRDIFYRMGFNDQEIVALIGAHSLGRCHPEASGYDGPWTKAPTFFSNDFYRELLEKKWTPRQWKGPLQYEDPNKELMMLPGDLALIQDPQFKQYVVLYSQDEEAFKRDFAKAFGKLLDLGVDRSAAPAKAIETKAAASSGGSWLSWIGLGGSSK